jgi:hypothetical protein
MTTCIVFLALRHRTWNRIAKSLPSILGAKNVRPAHFLGPAKRGKPGTYMQYAYTSQVPSTALHVSAGRGQGSFFGGT